MPQRLLTWNVRTWLRVGAYLLLAAVTVAGFYRLQQITDGNRKAVDALCAQRADLDEQIRATDELLRENEGDTIFAIPRQLILDGQRRNKNTRKNLNILDC